MIDNVFPTVAVPEIEKVVLPSFTALTVIFISCVSVLPSSSLIVMVNASVPLKFSLGL